MASPKEAEKSSAMCKTNTNACHEAGQIDGEETTAVFASELMASVEAARLKAHLGLSKHGGGRRTTLARHQNIFKEAQRTKALEATRIPQEKIKAAILARKRKTTFQFMDLPAEMRDAVYEHLAHDIKLCKSTYTEVAMEGGPRLSLLTVSRQFRKEYSESINRAAKLIISDRAEEHVPTKLDSDAKIAITQAMGFTAAFELRLFALCSSADKGHRMNDPAKCDILREIRNHTLWIRDIAPQIRDVKPGQISLLAHFSVAKDTECKGARWPAPLLGHDVESILKELVRPLQLPVTISYVTSEVPWLVPSSWEEWEEEWSSAEAYGTWTKQDGWRAAAEKTSEVGDE
ncbi:hypothetical protein HII31_12427 [Pseudocercospora fuligena]|uniref:F-box domain-containing protein n=1 Tax=Pseudocercospora fuligena TaxID=685502 RepID=A0A8H6R5E6_9PEZI|nr:hypothetical protein HII31_12427 [Pseudocercospora fuligena]